MFERARRPPRALREIHWRAKKEGAKSSKSQEASKSAPGPLLEPPVDDLGSHLGTITVWALDVS